MNRTIQVGFLIILLFTGSAFPADSTRQVHGPKLQFISVEHDFGEVLEGRVVGTSFRFVNTGDSLLVLNRVNSSCGCTIASWPKEGILPGDTNEIEVKFNSRGRYGVFVKSFTVYSNASLEPVVLVIRGKVVLPVIEEADSNALISPVRQD